MVIMKSRRFGLPIFVGYLALALLFFSFGAFAEKWTPFEFKGNELYRYEVNWGEGKKESAITA